MATDERLKKYAKILVDYSVFVKPGETVIISSTTTTQDLVLEVYKRILDKGAYPQTRLGIPGTAYYFYKHANDKQLKRKPKLFEYQIKNADKYIGIGAPLNTREFTNVDPKKVAIRNKVMQPITTMIVDNKPKMNRCTAQFPTNALAMDSEMSLAEYEDFFYKAVLQDWPKFTKKLQRMANRLNKGKQLRLVSKDTDLTMNIHPNSFIIDDGKENMPGGEVFGAPAKYSVEGHIRFTYPAIRDGREVTNVYLEFKKGKIVKATADKNEDFLKKMIATDAGSHYLGEIGIGMNPGVTKFTKNLLFDEKLIKTMHFAIGKAYKECGEPNKSALHWDIVKDISKTKVYLDGKLVTKNGLWLI